MNKGKDLIPLKDIKPWAVRHGLCLDLEKYEIDGRSRLGLAIYAAKSALTQMFPDGRPEVAALPNCFQKRPSNQGKTSHFPREDYG